MQDYYKYWGKASKPKDENGEKIKDAPVQYHLLVYHCLDVAAVADCLLASEQLNYLQPLAKELQVEPKWLRKWLIFCIALHDIGKFFRCFQNKTCNDITALVAENLSLINLHHSEAGVLLWGKNSLDFRKRFADIFPDKKLRRIIFNWMEIVCAHHGKPVETNSNQAITAYLVKEEDDCAAEEFIRDIYYLLFNNEDIDIISKIDKDAFKYTSWLMEGITVFSDWLGSNQSFFSYNQQPMPLEYYWHKHALPAAKKALAAVYKKKQVADFISIKQQFDFINQLTPLQQYVNDLQLTNEPQLFIIEDVTGAGKTEAAMGITHKLLAQDLARGLYVGLPTMATSNAMYKRMKKSYKALFTADSEVSLVLSHSASELSEEFQNSILSEQPVDTNYDKTDHTASAYCNSWFADNRKKALLADIGVGTIDQALMAVLPVKFQCLRMLGLHNKVLLLDEIHAYDTYTSEILISLLTMHRRNGGSAIILSATLQQQTREKLIAIYNNADYQLNNKYPLVTQITTNAINQQYVTTRDAVKRKTIINKLDSEQQALAKIKQAVNQGQCICWIRNTVADATKIYNILQQDSEIDNNKLTLFHSRFAMCDRQKIENKVLEIFDKKSTATQRQGQILIATQVVEQSLDLDFDVLITDLAPIDLIIQRIGRLKRHIRDKQGNPIEVVTGNTKDQRPPAEAYILMPDPNKVTDSKWLAKLLPGTNLVYKDTSILWKTAKILVDNGSISMPDDARNLIDTVYTNTKIETPQVLQPSSNNAEGNKAADRNHAEFNILKLDNGYTKASSERWHDDSNISTRSSEVDTYAIILVKLHNNKLCFYKWQDTKVKSILLSQITIPHNYWEQAQKYIPDTIKPQIEEFKTKHYLKDFHHIFPLISETEDFYNVETGWIKIN